MYPGARNHTSTCPVVDRPPSRASTQRQRRKQLSRCIRAAELEANGGPIRHTLRERNYADRLPAFPEVDPVVSSPRASRHRIRRILLVVIVCSGTKALEVRWCGGVEVWMEEYVDVWMCGGVKVWMYVGVDV